MKCDKCEEAEATNGIHCQECYDMLMNSKCSCGSGKAFKDCHFVDDDGDVDGKRND